MIQKTELLYAKSCFPPAAHPLLSATFGIKNHPTTTGYETYLFLFLLLFPYNAKRAEVSRVHTAPWWSFAAPHRPREVPGPASQALWPACELLPLRPDGAAMRLPWRDPNVQPLPELRSDCPLLPSLTTPFPIPGGQRGPPPCPPRS
jgi:hypothetical protein